MSRIMRFSKVPGINFRKSEKSQKVTLYDLDLKGSFE